MSNKNAETPIVRDEVIIALVQPVGADLTNVRLGLSEACKRIGAPHVFINLTSLVSDRIEEAKTKLSVQPMAPGTQSSTFLTRLVNAISSQREMSKNYLDISLKMHAGTNLRKDCGANDAFAKYAAVQISHARTKLTPTPTVFILDSLKHVDEVGYLRQAYGSSFYVIAINAGHDERKRHLVAAKGMRVEEAEELMSRDENEQDDKSMGVKHGQQAGKTFEQADFFVSIHTPSDRFLRFLELAFGNPHHSPERHEYFMHLAATASAMSSDLGRQVGALIVDSFGEIAALGYNEVPSPYGGVQAENDDIDTRDKNMGIDPNRKRINEILSAMGASTTHDGGKKIENLIEYHRTVHAELEALISCARKGLTIRGGTLYTTTFPCHNCAKHIAAAGIAEVVYVDDYSKSLAFDLHSDVMTLFTGNKSQKNGVSIRRFQGIGPRRYLGFFSQTLSTGRVTRRKEDASGKVVPYDPGKAITKYPVFIGQASLVEAVSKDILLTWKEIHGQDDSKFDEWLTSKLQVA